VPLMKPDLARSFLLALLVALPVLAAPPPALQEAVDAYEQGRLQQAREAFLKLSRAGVPAADYNLAVMHLRGEMPRPSTSEAVRLMTRAAQHGFVTAMVDLGRLYEGGGAGPVDLGTANRWYLQAAEAGSVDAQVAIGTAHYLGRGASKDPALAARWYREAAMGGDVGAQYLIASMYEGGYGVDRDLRLARYWYDIAAKNGDEAAPGKVKEIDAKLAASPSTPAK
jgi:TPR repeat protein